MLYPTIWLLVCTTGQKASSCSCCNWRTSRIRRRRWWRPFPHLGLLSGAGLAAFAPSVMYDSGLSKLLLSKALLVPFLRELLWSYHWGATVKFCPYFEMTKQEVVGQIPILFDINTVNPVVTIFLQFPSSIAAALFGPRRQWLNTDTACTLLPTTSHKSATFYWFWWGWGQGRTAQAFWRRGKARKKNVRKKWRDKKQHVKPRAPLSWEIASWGLNLNTAERLFHLVVSNCLQQLRPVCTHLLIISSLSEPSSNCA